MYFIFDQTRECFVRDLDISVLEKPEANYLF